MNDSESEHNEIDLQALITKMQSLETLLLLTRNELKITQTELQKSQDYINHSFIGSVSAFAMLEIPEGWLICDGQEISRSVYARLFEAINTIYGEGDGSTTFNLPDIRGLFIRGHDPVGKIDSKREFASYQEDQIQSHSHTDSGHSHSRSTGLEGKHSHLVSTEESGRHSHNASSSNDGRHNHCFHRYSNGDIFRAMGFYKKPRGGENTEHSGEILASIGRDGVMWTHKASVYVDVYADYISNCDFAVSHSHSISINAADSHSHIVNVDLAGSHTHPVSIDNGKANLSNPTNTRHGIKTRVKNIALIYCIKY